ncbi:MAG: GLUG motif-containing protein, partial [Clostridia bacterium]
VNGYNNFGTGGDASGRAADSSNIYLGGIVGYNTGGSIRNNTFRGTLKVVRSMHHNTANNLYLGGIVGFNASASSVINNTVTQASIMAHYNIRTAQNQGGAIHYAYVGATAGNNAYSTRGTVSNTDLKVQVVGSAGSGERKERGKNWLGLYNSNASQYGYVRFRLTWADTSGTSIEYLRHTDRSIPTDLYTTRSWVGSYRYDYVGTLREVRNA